MLVLSPLLFWLQEQFESRRLLAGRASLELAGTLAVLGPINECESGFTVTTASLLIVDGFGMLPRTLVLPAVSVPPLLLLRLLLLLLRLLLSLLSRAARWYVNAMLYTLTNESLAQDSLSIVVTAAKVFVFVCVAGT